MQQRISEETVTFYGRYLKTENGYCFNWTGSGFEFRFCGTDAKVKLSHQEQNLVEWAPFVSIFVDGTDYRRIWVGNDSLLPLCSGLEYGEHTVRVLKNSETCAQPLTAEFLEILSEGGKAAMLLSPPEPSTRKIEFIGDSITCGFGNLSLPEQYGFFTADEDGQLSYAALTAAYFGADSRMIAMSGKGVVFNCDRSTNMRIPVFYERTLSNLEKPLWDFQSWQPDVIVINAGTNDTGGGATIEEATEGAVRFLQQVRNVNPYAIIIWCYGLMVNRLEPAFQKAVELFGGAEKNSYFLPFDSITAEAGEIGSMGHPNVKGHQRGAEVLIQRIKELTGWEKA